MKVLVFNPLRKAQVRGISRYAAELATALRDRGHIVHEVSLPASFGMLPQAAQVLIFVLLQQIVVPVLALLHRTQLIVDPYNSYSLLAAVFFPTLAVYHDFIAVQRPRWGLKPGALYQRALHLIAPWLPRLRIGCVSPQTLRHAHHYIPGKQAVLAPNIVVALSADGGFCEMEDVLVQECRRYASKGFLTLCTVSGEGRNKDFSGLVSAASALQQPVYLVAFGFRTTEPPSDRAADGNGAPVVVRRVGRVSGATMARVIRESSLFVFHSLAEGFGRPIVEALIEEKVVVSSTVPALEMLSAEAMHNVVVCKDLTQFSRCVQEGLSRPFRAIPQMFASTFEEAIAAVAQHPSTQCTSDRVQ